MTCLDRRGADQVNIDYYIWPSQINIVYDSAGPFGNPLGVHVILKGLGIRGLIHCYLFNLVTFSWSEYSH